MRSDSGRPRLIELGGDLYRADYQRATARSIDKRKESEENDSLRFYHPNSRGQINCQSRINTGRVHFELYRSNFILWFISKAFPTAPIRDYRLAIRRITRTTSKDRFNLVLETLRRELFSSALSIR